MLIKCPSCGLQSDCEPGKYLCRCGTILDVASDGTATVTDGTETITDGTATVTDEPEPVTDEPATVSAGSHGRKNPRWIVPVVFVVLPILCVVGMGVFLQQAEARKQEKFAFWVEMDRRMGVEFAENGRVLVKVPENISDYKIPDGVTLIADRAFESRKKLTSVTIPSSVKRIGMTFAGCTSLTTVTIPEGVRSIEPGAFFNCYNLPSVTIPSSVTSIGPEAFYGCQDLTSITIPSGVTSIGEETFFRCRSLTSVMIPEGVTSIGESAFYDCTSLKSVTIPSSVTRIGKGAFNGAGCEAQVKRDYPHLYR